MIKDFFHPTDNEDLKILTDILQHSGANPEERKRIETEKEAWRTVNAMLENKENELLEVIEEKDKALEEKDKAIEEKDKALEDKDKALEEKDKALEDKDKVIEELKRKLGEK